MRKIVLFAALMCTVNSIGLAQVSINGFVRNYDSVSLSRDEELFRRNWLRLNFEYKPEGAKLYASIDFINDSLFNTNALEENLREAYVDFSLGPIDWKIGKQQIVWGNADGVLITDIVNPFDLRNNFLVYDFPDMRIGLNSVKATYYYKETGLEAVWIPTFVPHQLAPPGAPWAFTPPTPPIPIQALRPPELPDNSLSNSEGGARFLTRLKGFDITLNYLYAWDDLPAFHKKVEVNPATGPGLVVSPRFHRVHVPGYSIVNAFGSFVVKSEGAFFLDKFFDTTNPQAKDLLVESPFLNYMVGVDYKISENWLLLGQWIQSMIVEDDEQILQDRIQTGVTLRLSAELLDQDLKPSVFAYYNFHDKDIWVWPEITYKILDGLNGTLGMHLFEGDAPTPAPPGEGIEGDAQEFFGQFDKNDYAYLKVQYSF